MSDYWSDQRYEDALFAKPCESCGVSGGISNYAKREVQQEVESALLYRPNLTDEQVKRVARETGRQCGIPERLLEAWLDCEKHWPKE